MLIVVDLENAIKYEYKEKYHSTSLCHPEISIIISLADYRIFS